MRVFKIVTALIVSGMIFYVGTNADATTNREIMKTKAVSVAYKSKKSVYKYAHRACQKYWQKDISNVVSEHPTFSVEIVTVNTDTKTLSALCVSKKYINDDVRRVARR